MDRKLAHVEVIKELRPIPNADKIETCVILGWECVVKKGEFKLGEKVVYVEVDSILPEKPEYEFLRERKFRIRTIKLRKQVSQGLVLPLSSLPKKALGYSIGQDVTTLLDIVKYESPSEKSENTTSKNPFVKFMSRFKWFRKLFLTKVSGSFPSWIQKTDEERIQNIPEVLVYNKDVPFYMTEKLDGQSATYYLRRVTGKFGKQGYEFGVCSRNLKLSKPDSSNWWIIAKEYDIENVLKRIIDKDEEYVILQGEIVGTGNSAVQGNKYKLNGLKFFAFNLKFPQKRLSPPQMENVLSEYGVQCVPLLGIEYLPEKVEDLIVWTYGKSKLNSDVIREGIVFRNYDRNISFKAINPDFLLKNEE